MAGPGVDLVMMRFDRQTLSPQEDPAIITMHARGVTAALPDDLFPMDDAARTNFATKLDAFWTAIRVGMSDKYQLIDYRFYALPAAAGQPMGAPDKVITKNLFAGSATDGIASQVAVSVTWITDKRATWGRFYLPGIAINKFGASRIDTAWCDTIANASRSGNGGTLTVWSHKEWTHHDPQFVQVDDVPDVIRSRRLRSTHYRAKQPCG
jgi:hypothetical protein